MLSNYISENGNKKAGLLFSLMMIFFVAFNLIVSLILTITKVEGDLLSALSTVSILLASLFASVFTTKEKKELLNLVNKKFNPLYIILPFTIAFSMIFGLGFINSLVEEFFFGLGLKTTTTEFSLGGVWEYLLFTLFLAVIPAVCEELFFRGVLIRELKTNNLAKVLISALCFSLYHLSINKLVYQFIYGVVLGLLYIKTENLILPIITHFLNNFIILTVEFLGLTVNLFNPLLIATSIVIFALSVFLLVFRKNLTKKSENDQSVKDFFLPFSLMGFSVCLVIIIGGLFV